MLESAQSANGKEFATQMVKAMARAIDLVCRERAHHFLCIRATTAMSQYKQTWESAWAARLETTSEDERRILRAWYQEIDLMEHAAIEDLKYDLESVKRRSIILLADLMESYIESVLQLCLVYWLETPEKIRSVTGVAPREIDDPVEVKRCVRKWERTKFPDFRNRRADRLTAMLRTFIPIESIDNDIMDEIFEHRNALTHEIIQISSNTSEKFRSADASMIDIQRIDIYFNYVGDFILRSMDAFKKYRNPDHA